MLKPTLTPISRVVFASLTIVALLAVPLSAHASILFGPSASYVTVKSTDTTGLASSTDTTALVADGKLGWLIEGTVLYFGGLYSYESNGGSTATKLSGSNYGPTIGIFDGAFALLGTYLMSAERTYPTTSGNAKLSNGSGFRVDMSYVAGLTGAIGVGPQLTYRDIKYTKSTPAGGVETSANSYEESTFYPSLIFWFRF